MVAAPNPGTGHVYYYDFTLNNGFTTVSLSSQEAIAFAASFTYRGVRGHLLAIEDIFEQIFINSIAADNVSFTTAWVDGSDASSSRIFKHQAGPATGNALNFTNWDSSSPDDVLSNNCIAFNTSSGYWMDVNCSAPLPVIVEFECPSGQHFGAKKCESLSIVLTSSVILTYLYFIIFCVIFLH